MRDLFKRLRGSNKEDIEKAVPVEQRPAQASAGEEQAPAPGADAEQISEDAAGAGSPGDGNDSGPGDSATAESDSSPEANAGEVIGEALDEDSGEASGETSSEGSSEQPVDADIQYADAILVTEPGGIDLTRPMQAAIDQTAITPQRLKVEVKVEADVPIIRAVQRCNIGKVRSRNEDSSYIFTAEASGQEPLPPFGLYIVADGMGGHHAGHDASRKVSRIVAQQVLEKIYLPILRNSTETPGPAQEPISEVMLNAVQAANERIHSPDPEKDSGTTLTAALLFGHRLYLAHVGDSRAYVLANDELKQITTDHSYVRRLQDAGQLTEAEAAVHPQRNMLYKAVGQGGDLEIDAFTQSLPQQGKLLLSSDGHWGLVPDEMTKHVLQQDIPLSEMADQLVKLALQAGGYDNITVIIVDFDL